MTMHSNNRLFTSNPFINITFKTSTISQKKSIFRMLKSQSTKILIIHCTFVCH